MLNILISGGMLKKNSDLLNVWCVQYYLKQPNCRGGLNSDGPCLHHKYLCAYTCDCFSEISEALQSMFSTFTAGRNRICSLLL